MKKCLDFKVIKRDYITERILLGIYDHSSPKLLHIIKIYALLGESLLAIAAHLCSQNPLCQVIPVPPRALLIAIEPDLD